MIGNIEAFIFPATFALLPKVMDTPEARAMLLAIGLQESQFEARRQMGEGPARGFWQFEKGGGVKGVLTHTATRLLAEHVCAELCYLPSVESCYVAIEHNDVLACAFARLLLWTLPGRLPKRFMHPEAWLQYKAAWRPGRPHEAMWKGNFTHAWDLTEMS